MGNCMLAIASGSPSGVFVMEKVLLWRVAISATKASPELLRSVLGRGVEKKRSVARSIA